MLQDNYLCADELSELETARFHPAPRVRSQLNINLHSPHSQFRAKVESFIADKFQHHHSASIREFMPLLIDLGYDNTKNAAVGIRTGVHKPLFLESYLDCTIEDAVTALAGVSIRREYIVEIGNFAASNVRSGGLLFTLLAKALLLAGYQWMAFTATNEVEKMINKLGCRQTILTDANASRVEQSSSDWGSYYVNTPKVIACNLLDSINRAETSTRLKQVFINHSDQINRLALELQSTNNWVSV